LLVVIAIIAILAAILFPVFARARAKAQETSCMSNVKQIALGVLMYTQDYDNCYPVLNYMAPGLGANDDKIFWPYVVDPYIKAGTPRAWVGSNLGIWQCPSARLQAASAGGAYVWYGGAYSHYALNAYLGAVNDSQVRSPSQTMLVTEGKYWNATRGEWWGWYASYGYNDASAYTRYDHDDRANISFCDGHVKNGTEQQWLSGEWKRRPDGSS
jgi:prepilin-type processing-associated H-X9-DG protein